MNTEYYDPVRPQMLSEGHGGFVSYSQAVLCAFVLLRVALESTKKSRDFYRFHHFVDFLLGEGEQGKALNAVYFPRTNARGRH